jgi:hypothetical protein
MGWKTYGKTIAVLLATLVMAGITAYRAVAADGVSASEWVLVVIAVAGTVNVWATANVPAFAKAKTLVGAIFLVLNLLVGFITGGISGDEWMLLAIQFLGALGLAIAPAVSSLSGSTSVGAPAKFVAGSSR